MIDRGSFSTSYRAAGSPVIKSSSEDRLSTFLTTAAPYSPNVDR
jgi:hypothetical protein